MKGLFNRHFWKFFVGFLAIMAGGFLWLVWANIYHNGKQAEQSKAEKYLKDLEKAYQNDTYGGKTPEETLALFIDALKKGDTDLAAKYFVVEKQDEWRKNLGKVKEGGELNSMIKDLNNFKQGKDLNKSSTVFSFVNESNEVVGVMNIAQVPNGTWKIVDL